MKIIVIIPTLNESDNIRFITRIIDEGLKKVPKKIKAIIINADSGSTDQTREIFLNTETHFPKKTILCKSKNRYIGKGRNIFEVLKIFRKSADYFLMLDADVTSAKMEWINKFLKPLLSHEAELVTPIYKRNRYEGNTTNHFSSPIIYACLGEYVAQPIAGDFAFTKKLANKVYQSFSSNSDYGYGIDTLITWTVFLNNLRVVQVELGQKIHKPSFSKIIKMFEQVTNSTLKLINKNRTKILFSLNKNTFLLPKSETIDEKYFKIPSKKQIEETEKNAIKLLDRYKSPKINLSIKINEPLDTKKWVNVLSEYTKVVLTEELNTKELSLISKSLTGYYLLRVLSYFKEIENLTVSDITKLLVTQRNMLRDAIIKKTSVEDKRCVSQANL